MKILPFSHALVVDGYNISSIRTKSDCEKWVHRKPGSIPQNRNKIYMCRKKRIYKICFNLTECFKIHQKK